MAEWGKYLKNAVANVEQQLDKVLLEQQIPDGKATSRTTAKVAAKNAAGRPDLSERLRQAAGGRGSMDESRASLSDDAMSDIAARTDEAEPKAASVDAPDMPSSSPQQSPSKETAETLNLVTVGEFLTAPDLSSVLIKAKQVALALHRDDTLELVEDLQRTQQQLEGYVENTATRLLSLNSKIAILSRDKAESSTDKDRQIALLMEEGHRLSKRELELNLIIKKLRSDRASAVSKGELVEVKNRELDDLKASYERLQAKFKEQEALVEHFRLLSEEAAGARGAPEISSVSIDGKDDAQPGQSSDAVHRQQREERAKWHKTEAALLSRIAELEEDHEKRSQTMLSLQQRLGEAQEVARSSRDSITALQEESDRAKSANSVMETRFKAQLNDLTTEIIIKEKESEAQQKELSSLQEQLISLQKAMEDNKAFALDRSDHSRQVSPMLSEIDAQEPYRNSSPRSEAYSRQSLRSMISKEGRVTRPRKDSYSNLTLSHLDQVAVGPAGPFGGALHEEIDEVPRPPVDASQGEISEAADDSTGFSNVPRRESSIHGSESLQGSQLHLVRKLTISIRKLENELVSAHKASELSKLQRDEAQAEIAQLVSVQETAQRLEAAYSKLEHAHEELKAQWEDSQARLTDKDERIEELEADVRDLKELYREQVEALISEIETLKNR